MSNNIMDIRINERVCSSLIKSYRDTQKEQPYSLRFDFDDSVFTIRDLQKVDLELLAHSILSSLKEE